MITILLVNLVGVSIYVAGVGLCLRTTKRTGNIGYLLLAGYFAAVLLTSSMEQVERMQEGPRAAGHVEVVAEPAKGQLEPPEAEAETVPGEVQETAPLAEGGGGSEGAEKEPEVVPDSPWEGVTFPILPALLLAGVAIVSRDDPRRREEAEDQPAADEAEAAPVESEEEVRQGQEPSAGDGGPTQRA